MNLNEMKLTIDALKSRAYRVGPNSPEYEGLLEEAKRLEKEYLSKSDKKANTNTKPRWATEESPKKKPQAKGKRKPNTRNKRRR